METIQEELNELFFDDSDILQEIKLMDKNIAKKIKDKLIAVIKSKNPKNLNKLLKPVPTKSLDDIHTLLRKRVIKNKQKFDKNFKIANRKIVRVKNDSAKHALSLAAATAATATDKSVEELIDENRRVFDPKNLVMLLLGILYLSNFFIAGGAAAYQNPVFATMLAAAAGLMIIKVTYNLIAGKEAKSLFLIL